MKPPVLRTRERIPELMDQPGLDPRDHRRALDGLGRSHVLSRSLTTLWPAIRRAAEGVSPRPLRILDLACGGGQLVLAVYRALRAAGLDGEVWGADSSPVALAYASRLAGRAGITTPAIGFIKLDAVHDPLPGDFDVVCSTLFLHHLADEEALALLAGMARAARRLVLVSDLRRTRLGLFMAWAGVRLVSPCHVLHVDATRSVRAAFTTAEARRLADAAGLAGAVVTERWPQRFVLEWSPPAQ